MSPCAPAGGGGTRVKGVALLKLRKVELLGFKSFCEKTHVTFNGAGITCVVGPNGCGKSNIVDAISWVLGEQSHKSLRAERMADCIFNGTQKRPPLGMAEVTLTLVDLELAEAAEKVLENSEAEEVEEVKEVEEAEEEAEGKQFPKKRAGKASAAGGRTKPGEVVVGRRLYRSGLSEYLINDRVARLRDIQELFMGTGLGPDTYAIIEQGRIGQILSSKPMDRRAIIEEAAGVTKYKTKRRLAEAKLESSKLNLARVNDILVEVEKQLGSLKRQASKARRYAEIREQMRGLIRAVLASKAAELDAEAERLAQLVKEIAATEAQQTQALAALETEQDRLARRNYELETELRQNQNLLGQTALELDRAENRIGFNRERMRELDTRSAQLATEIELAQQQAAQLEERARAHAVSVTALREEEAQLAAALQQLVERAAALAAEQQATESRIEEVRQASGRLGEELRRLHGEQAQAEEALAHHADAQARLEQAAEKLRAEATQHRERSTAAEAAWQAAESEAQRLAQAVRNAQGRLAQLRNEQQQTTHRVERTREELTTVRARRKSVEQILNERSYSAEAVQKLFAANGKGEHQGFRAVGLLADYAEVQEQYEVAIEQFLREELEYVVVETYDHARAGISLLREEMGGQATFFVDSLRNLKISSEEPLVPFRAQAGVVSRLDRLVEFRDPLGSAAKQFLPRLQSGYLVETSGVAEQLARENPCHHFLTVAGTCYHGRMVTGGRPGEAGPLAMKRELRAIEAQAMQLERETEVAQAALRKIEGELATCERLLEEASAQNVEAQKAQVATTLQRDLARSESAKAEQRLAECTGELARLASETRAARERAEQARLRQSEACDSRTAAENELLQRAERLAVLRQQLQLQQEEVSTRRAELATLSERLASAESVAARIEEERQQVRERETSLGEQQANIARERAELETNTAEQERRVEALRAEKARLEELRKQLDEEWDGVRVRTVEVDDALRQARQRLGDLREQRGQHEVERARNESDRNHLRETCLAELNAHPEDLIAQEPRLLAGEELVVAETSYREMKAKIEAMDPINMMALEEYQECEQRFAFLSRERDDLVKSIEDTQQTIRELDEVSRQKFENAFTVINRNFAEVFRTLFGGGTGEMRLTEPDSTGDTGMDIVAQPPGKRLQNVMLLSGGEKALAALALLIAIFKFQPSPFCILDEVDAPLDEANVGRFNKLLADMGEQTQFIIVTHNRRTMESAPALYGVTMQEPGVSKLVSVRWDEPQVEPQPTAA
jgi:chromosome segregation protein